MLIGLQSGGAAFMASSLTQQANAGSSGGVPLI
jgi:hypothetical protein